MGKNARSLLVAPVLLAALLGCRADSPENQVRKAFEGCRAAVEAGDADAAMAPLDLAFRGPEGMDRATARLFLLGSLREEKVGITVMRNEVTVKRNEAVQDVDLILTERGGGLIPQDASHRSFHLRWRKASGDWKLVEVQSFDGR